MFTDTNLTHTCDCGKPAVWDYAPGFSSGENSYFCDDCVPRGCECNHVYVSHEDEHLSMFSAEYPVGEENIDWKWIVPNKSWTTLDEKCREYPCCEYWYDENGFDIHES